MTSARPPLDETALRAALLAPRGPWRDVRVVARTGSTNDDLVARARSGGTFPARAVLVAEEQVAGRGRHGRTWQAPPRSALLFSVALAEPAVVPGERWGWLPLLSGLAVASGVRRSTGLDARLKWPNDVLVGERKIAGVLCEVVPGGVVVGVGLNADLDRSELPVATATSLRREGVTAGREDVLVAVLQELHAEVDAWAGTGGDAAASPGGAPSLQDRYLDRSATVGRRVRASLPGGDVHDGEALGVDGTGRLVLRAATGVERALAAGEVLHLRATMAG